MKLPAVNGNRNITVRTVTAILSLIGIVVGAAWALDYRYASKERVADGFSNVLDAIANMKCATIRQELNEIILRQEHNEMTSYDQGRKNNLQLRWQRECLGGGGK